MSERQKQTERELRDRIVELRRKADLAYEDGQMERGADLDRLANQAVDDLHRIEAI